MFKNYLKIALRNLLKHRLFTFMNIFGLSMAMACCIVVFLFMDWQYGQDVNHKNAEKIFLANYSLEIEGKRQTWGDSPVPLGPALKADFPQIEYAVRVADGRATLRYGDQVFDERVRFVDPEFLRMFTFPLQSGFPNPLSDKNGVVLGKEVAEKYFGDENPAGKQIEITFKDGRREAFVVKGVTAKFDKRTSFDFEVLLHYDKQFDLGLIPLEQQNDWRVMTRATFIQLRDPAAIDAIAGQMDGYVKAQNAANIDRPIAAFTFDPLLNIAFNAHKVRQSISGASTPAERVLLLVLGVLILALACFNFMNIALAAAGRRLNEIGIRKVIGGLKRQLVMQFLSENLLVTFMALAVAIALAEIFFVPAFNALFSNVLELDFEPWSNERLWAFFLAIVIAVGIGAGAYPAFYISAFQPAAILKGKQKLGGRNVFTRFLLTFQFLLAFFLIVAGVVFTQNIAHQRSRDWGYEQEQAIVVPLEGGKYFAMLKNAIAQLPDVVSTAGSKNHLGRSFATGIVEIPATNPPRRENVARFDVGFDYLETMQARLALGRFFDRNFSTDLDQAVIVNQSFVQTMPWENPINERIILEGKTYQVIGVVEDFHYRSFRYKIEPALFKLAAEDEFSYLIVRAKAGAVIQTAEAISKTWRQLIPEAPYSGFFQDEVFAAFYQEGEGVKKIFSFMAFIAVIISCTGLFGLVSIHLTRRMKEIGIRKVLGASLLQVANLINREFVFVIVIAMLISAPLSYYAIYGMLGALYEYRVDAGVLPFVFAGILIFLTAGLTISTQVYKAATANPATVLRSE